jgi:hemoglobin
MTTSCGSADTTAAHRAPESVYARLGGAPAIHRLVDRFYGLMDELPEAHAVRQLHPSSLSGSSDSLFKFLSGWFGGPALYMLERGHPRLRMRHAPYAINAAMRDEWMLCMQLALAEQVDDLALHASIQRAFSDMADHLVNTDPLVGCP